MAEDSVVGRSCIEPELTENARITLEARYLKRVDGKVIETPAEMFRRVAKAVAAVEVTKYKSTAETSRFLEDLFYDMMVTRRFLPNSPTLMNGGKNNGHGLFACYVLPVPDSVDGIFSSIKTTALIQKGGGGTGFSFDSLRSSGEYISSSGGTTSGPISFWRAFSEATNSIQQGSYRRGANMAMMSVTTPDCLKFLSVKRDLSQFNNYNISVKIPDWWFKLLGTKAPYKVYSFRSSQWYVVPRTVLTKVQEALRSGLQDGRHWRDIDGCYSIHDMVPIESETSTVTEGDWLTVDDVWSMIVSYAHQTGEPGVCFIDRIRETEPTAHIGYIEASNPCGEVYLLPNEACNLGSINLSQFTEVDPGNMGADDWMSWVDWAGLEDTVRLAVRFLDNIVDANEYPSEDIQDICHRNRKIGLGVMGLADALFTLRIPYDSPEGRSVAAEFLKVVNKAGMAAELKLAEERGTFPNYKGSSWDRKGIPMRNAELSSIAPTGTISLIAGCSCGIEPLFSLIFHRNILKETGNEPLLEINPIFKEAAQKGGFWSEQLAKRILADGSIQGLLELPEKIRDVFKTAMDISPEDHIRMQATVQTYVTNSVSKTINLPNSASVEDVDSAFRLAHELRCKSTTVYRDGSRREQPMALDKSDSPPVISPSGELVPVSLPEVLPGIRVRQNTLFGHAHVTITVDPETGREREVFAQIGNAGGIEQADLEAICRLASMLLRSNYPISGIIGQLQGIGTAIQKTSPEQIASLPKALSAALDRYLQAKQEFGLESLLLGKAHVVGIDRNYVTKEHLQKFSEGPIGYHIKCPYGEENCRGKIVRHGMCVMCDTCGLSTCG